MGPCTQGLLLGPPGPRHPETRYCSCPLFEMLCRRQKNFVVLLVDNHQRRGGQANPPPPPAEPPPPFLTHLCFSLQYPHPPAH